MGCKSRLMMVAPSSFFGWFAFPGRFCAEYAGRRQGGPCARVAWARAAPFRGATPLYWRNSRACCSPRFRLFISHVHHTSAGLATKGHISATIMTVMQLLTAVHRLFYCSLAFPKNGKKPGSSVEFPGSFWGFSSLVSCALGSQMFSASSRFSRERLALSFCARTSAGPRFSSVN